MPADKSWREVAAPIITRVLIETAGQPDKEIKRALKIAYPFGERNYHPYKVWLKEVRRQRGLKDPRPVGVPDPNQMTFELGAQG